MKVGPLSVALEAGCYSFSLGLGESVTTTRIVWKQCNNDTYTEYTKRWNEYKRWLVS